MNFVSCSHFVSLFLFFGVAVLVIVNGQSTIDDDIDKDEIGRDTVEMLREEFRAALRAERAKSADAINSLKSQLAVSQNEIAKLKNKGKHKKSVSIVRLSRDRDQQCLNISILASDLLELMYTVANTAAVH